MDIKICFFVIVSFKCVVIIKLLKNKLIKGSHRSSLLLPLLSPLNPVLPLPSIFIVFSESSFQNYFSPQSNQVDICYFLIYLVLFFDKFDMKDDKDRNPDLFMFSLGGIVASSLLICVSICGFLTLVFFYFVSVLFLGNLDGSFFIYFFDQFWQ